jgi:hypothetical protein
VQIVVSSWTGLQPKNKTKQKLDRLKLTRITSKKSVRAKIRLNSAGLANCGNGDGLSKLDAAAA